MLVIRTNGTVIVETLLYRTSIHKGESVILVILKGAMDLSLIYEVNKLRGFKETKFKFVSQMRLSQFSSFIVFIV